jgi:hypothetical protein
MTDIREYITLSLTASAISSAYSIPADFKYYYNNIGNKEKKSLVRHFIVNNIPFAFKDKPILYEQIIQYIADKLYISPSEVKLIGSAKIGFSISPNIILPESWTRSLVKKSLNLTKRYDQTNPTQIHA